jgi:hypothetical protein
MGMMIERKIIITSCRECPFAEWKDSFYTTPRYVCKKIEKTIDYNSDQVDAQCPLKVNIPSKNFRENV